MRLGESELREYAKRFEKVKVDFEAAATSFGLPFAAPRKDGTSGITAAALRARAVENLAARGAHVENDGKSIWLNWLSPACVACRTGERTESFVTSMQCPRNCFFCFNPNQPNYEYYRTRENPLTQDLLDKYGRGERYDFVAVTGGEPLLHLEKTTAFLRLARELYPSAHTRLYTSGYRMDDAAVRALAEAGFDEVRLSVKLDDPKAGVDEALRVVERCVGRFGAVMVEMPVFPDHVDAMKRLLVGLDEAGAAGINMLELGFPFHNAEEFKRRGYLLKPDPYRVVYGYWYSGGLPIEGSERAALSLVEFALNAKLSLGVHYCALENRLTGQVYQQNAPAASSFPLRTMSPRDHFLKSAKAFGAAVKPVRAALDELGLGAQTDSLDAPSGSFLEFPLSSLEPLASRLPDVAVGISYGIAEQADGAYVLRELKLEQTTPAAFACAAQAV